MRVVHTVVSKAVAFVGCLSLLVLLIPVQSASAHAFIPTYKYKLTLIRPSSSAIGSVQVDQVHRCVSLSQQGYSYVMQTLYSATINVRIRRYSGGNCDGTTNPADLFTVMNQDTTVYLYNW